MRPTKGSRRPPGSAGAIAVLVAAVLSAGACSPDPERGPDARPNSVPTPTDQHRVAGTNGAGHGVAGTNGAGHVLFVANGRLKLRDVRSGRVRSMGPVPSLDVAASTTSPWLAYVAGEGAVAGDFIERPHLHLMDPRNRRRIDLGPGFAPLWKPAGGQLAFLRPVEERRCEAETCRGGSEVVVVDPNSREEEVVLGPGPWGLLAWAGDHLVVADRRDPNASLLVDPSRQTSRLDVAPAEFWDASPNGEWLLIARPGSAGFLPLEDGAPAGREVTVNLPAGLLAEGAWAPDSSSVAAALRSRSRSRLVTFSPDAPTPRAVPGASDVVGDVLWAQDASALTTTGVTDSGRRLEALHCRFRARPRCRALFSWIQDVLLLRME